LNLAAPGTLPPPALGIPGCPRVCAVRNEWHSINLEGAFAPKKNSKLGTFVA